MPSHLRNVALKFTTNTFSAPRFYCSGGGRDLEVGGHFPAKESPEAKKNDCEWRIM